MRTKRREVIPHASVDRRVQKLNLNCSVWSIESIVKIGRGKLHLKFSWNGFATPAYILIFSSRFRFVSFRLVEWTWPNGFLQAVACFVNTKMLYNLHCSTMCMCVCAWVWVWVCVCVFVYERVHCTVYRDIGTFRESNIWHATCVCRWICAWDSILIFYAPVMSCFRGGMCACVMRCAIVLHALKPNQTKPSYSINISSSNDTQPMCNVPVCWYLLIMH